ncbi:bromodomain associated family protein [Musa troglodytarum]|uniref:Transcription initiation factor TFIID subunit 8 n=1 Tax=Musa troglodytarum TaxID=320322 RepID=A0A9E7LAB6_9LILI|nr:bromodomain associated family protein [Musa troglodytarum]
MELRSVERISRPARRKVGRQETPISATPSPRLPSPRFASQLGFTVPHCSANDSLAEIAVRYICSLGKSANFYANLAGRTSCNVFDVIQEIQDMSLSCGFRGASDVRQCLVSSDVVREIAKFVSTEAEVPFFRPISRLPVPRVAKFTPGSPLGRHRNHIPDWLPRLPDPHTYLHTATDAKADLVEQTRQQRKTERLLLSLQQLLACSGVVGFQPTNGVGNDGKDKQEADAGKRLSVPEAYSSTVRKEAKVGSFVFDANGEKILPRSGPTVHFKIKIGVDNQSEAASPFSSERDSWLLRNDEKDDRRKEAKVESFAFDTDGEKILPRSRPTVHFKIKIGVDDQSAAAARFSSERDSWPLRDERR